MGLGGISLWQLLIVLLIVIIIFGTKRLSSLGSDLGGAVKGFRKAMSDSEKEADKAKRVVRAAVLRVAYHRALEPRREPVTQAALVVGGGIAGIQTALSIAESGYPVYLVEKEPSIGGHMAQLDKTFPTLDCSV